MNQAMTFGLFSLGRIVATPNALASIPHDDIAQAMGRHRIGDWGDTCEEDKKENDNSLKNQSRLLSVYTSSKGAKFWIITEADRSVTTVLMPEDY